MLIVDVESRLNEVVFPEIKGKGIDIHDEKNKITVLSMSYKYFPEINPKIISKTILRLLY